MLYSKGRNVDLAIHTTIQHEWQEHDTWKFPNPAKFVYVRYKYLRIANNSDSIRKMSITVRESDFKFQFIGSRLRSSMNGKVIGKTISLLKLWIVQPKFNEDFS